MYGEIENFSIFIFFFYSNMSNILQNHIDISKARAYHQLGEKWSCNLAL